VRELRTARKWSQEEFAHVSGLHRTYVGQIERGEKNISFENLTKISSVLALPLSELLAGLELGEPISSAKSHGVTISKREDLGRRMREVERLLRRLRLQRTEMDRTLLALEKVATGGQKHPRRLGAAPKR
jgi:transcriptional regulator with XRE-family HTH domain